jgi:thiol-disulfide isomerase/thioredoxin
LQVIETEFITLLDIAAIILYDGIQKQVSLSLMAIFIKFYTKPRCPLCDKARTLLNGLTKEYHLRVEEINILDNPILYGRYKYEIPVLLCPGLFQLQGRIEAENLRGKLDRASSQKKQ